MTVQELRKALEQFGDWEVMMEDDYGRCCKLKRVYKDGDIVLASILEEHEERETNP